ncbi:protein of unknown function DUF1697 [Caballeronia glathei]|uniref:DUF1697 domain-containing protein n=1 Tax=Caballeronia glathei TaxID=60547 RepID=A0A069PJD7_9BURK|nr:DUF1697 domain-containing protein [Caballeronia glathei]KDR40675.1 hypothetical protein BG61_23600 [Caballeronia glathei]CDY74913.1 protein of unknown function DUF1697 [Caballeronia glathei]
MTVFIALLRAVNVGGTGKLPMKDLAALCADLGFENVRTYIQSGNVVLSSRHAERSVQRKLEEALAAKAGKPVDVMVRSAAEMRAVLDHNPFPDAPPARVAVVFLAHDAPKRLGDDLVIPGGEEVRAAKRELYIHYPDGMGKSRLRLPAALVGTARNINTVGKLAEMAAA